MESTVREEGEYSKIGRRVQPERKENTAREKIEYSKRGKRAQQDRKENKARREGEYIKRENRVQHERKGITARAWRSSKTRMYRYRQGKGVLAREEKFNKARKKEYSNISIWEDRGEGRERERCVQYLGMG